MGIEGKSREINFNFDAVIEKLKKIIEDAEAEKDNQKEKTAENNKE